MSQCLKMLGNISFEFSRQNSERSEQCCKMRLFGVIFKHRDGDCCITFFCTFSLQKAVWHVISLGIKIDQKV